LRTTLFFEDTEDALYSQTNVTVVPNVVNIQNVDRIRTKGVEIAYQASDLVWRGFDVQWSVTYASSIIEKNDKFPASVGKWQPRVPRWRSSLLLSYRPNETWSGTLGVRYSGRQYSQLDNSDTNGYAYTGVSPFLVADARLRYRFDRNWSASLGVDNPHELRILEFPPVSAAHLARGTEVRLLTTDDHEETLRGDSRLRAGAAGLRAAREPRKGRRAAGEPRRIRRVRPARRDARGVQGRRACGAAALDG
jgi:hypothetical protein